MNSKKSEDLLVGIFRQEQDAKGEPAFYLTLKEARLLKRQNQGYFINSGNDLRLLERIEIVSRLMEESGLKFINPVQSRKIAGPGEPADISSMDMVVDAIWHDKNKRPLPYIAARELMRTNRQKPYPVTAAEAWA